VNEAKEFFFYLFILYFRLCSKFVFATNEALAAQTWQYNQWRKCCTTQSRSIQFGHTKWCGGHTTVKLSTCHVSGIFCALTAADIWRVARGWITRSGDSVLGRGDRVQIISGAQPTSYSMDADVLSRR